MKCAVIKCKNGCKGWMDIIDVKKNTKMENQKFGRFPFCKKHFNIIYPYIKKKEKEHFEKIIKDKGLIEAGWMFAPLNLVEEALNQKIKK